MPSEVTAPLKGFEEAEAAFKRMEPDAMALTEEQFAPMNVDVVGATSVILGVVGRVLPFRERIAKLSDFDIRHVDQLEDRAKAAWFAFVTNLPEPEPKDFQALFEECKVLRATMLAWAEPLVLEGHFERKSVDKIKEGSGNKDIPSDVVSLVTLFRSKWETVRGICGVTGAQLDRGAAIAPVVFATVARRENKTATSKTDGSQRVRRFWTLADRSYAQCERAINYLEFDNGGAAAILPKLRRNTGTKSGSPAEPAPVEPPAGPPAPAPPAGPVVGGGKDPFGR
jgi:hypothetical protein